MNAKNAEQEAIEQVAKSYEQKGYRVIIEPRGLDIPAFIADYQPDVIATSKRDNVVIEVKNRSDLSAIEALRDVADAINKTQHWRFELIVVYSENEKVSDILESYFDYNSFELAKNLKEAKDASSAGKYAAAFILCWATMESLSRQLLSADKRDVSNKMPLALIKTLFSYGHLSRTDFEDLTQLFRIRNQVVHGYKSDELDNDAVGRLFSITERLLLEKENLTSNDLLS